MQEHWIQVLRTARYYTLGTPSADVREVWIACHGYSQLARYFIRSFEAIDDGTRIIVAPEALNRYYQETAPGEHAADARVSATWMTREAREQEIGDYVAYLDDVAEEVVEGLAGAEPRVVALGFSQGTATVSRWAAMGTTRIDDVILWGAPAAHDLPLSRRVFRGARLLVAVGTEDPHVSDERVAEQDRRLRDAGVDYTLVRYDGGHRIETEPLRDLARIVAGGEAQPGPG